MNNSRITWLAATAALALGAALPGAASAQSTWTLISGSGCTQNATNNGNFGNSWACTGSGNAGTSVTASAYSNQAGSGSSAQSINAATQYANAYMSAQGSAGFGAANRTEGLTPLAPDHAVDNTNPTGSYDMIVLNFGSAVILSQIGVGWTSSSTGADISVFRWTGAGAPDSSTAAVTSGGNKALTKSGWTLVSSLADVLGDSVAPYGDLARNTYATTASSWWMVAAYNTTLAGSSCYTNNSGGTVAKNTNGKCDDGDDAFKLNWLKTSVASQFPPVRVPEPGTVALLAGALLAAGAVRRRAMSQR